MELLYDFRAYQDYYGRGIGRYVYELFSRVIRYNANGRNAILVASDKYIPDFALVPNSKVESYRKEDFTNGEVKGNFDAFLNGATTWLWRRGYHSLTDLYPAAIWEIAKIKTVILHDFVPLLYENHCPTIYDEINYLLQCEAIRYVDHIFTNSKYVLESGSRYLKRPQRDFTNLYGGADQKIFHTIRSGSKYERGGRNHDLINISAGCPRKNYCGVVEAFCRAWRSGEIPKDARLVMICDAPLHFISAIQAVAKRYRLGIGKQIVLTGYIADADMLKYIVDATCTIFPSYYEGLGLPILESYAAGTPCIAANISSMRELITEEAGFDPFRMDEITEKIIQIYRDDVMLEKSLAYGRDLLEQINWENSARIMYQKLEEMTAGEKLIWNRY